MLKKNRMRNRRGTIMGKREEEFSQELYAVGDIDMDGAPHTLTTQEKMLQKLITRLERVALTVERSGLQELLEYRGNMRKTLRHTFIMGMVRGLGTAVGITILGAVAVYILQKVVRYNLPLIGDVLADLLELIEAKS